MVVFPTLKSITFYQRWNFVVQRRDLKSTIKQRWNNVVCRLGVVWAKVLNERARGDGTEVKSKNYREKVRLLIKKTKTREGLEENGNIKGNCHYKKEQLGYYGGISRRKDKRRGHVYLLEVLEFFVIVKTRTTGLRYCWLRYVYSRRRRRLKTLTRHYCECNHRKIPLLALCVLVTEAWNVGQGHTRSSGISISYHNEQLVQVWWMQHP